MNRKFLFLIVLILSFTFSFIFFHIANGNKELNSPLPSFLSLKDNGQVSSIDVWIPAVSVFENFIKGQSASDISASSALVYDLTEKAVLYQKSAKSRLPMASLTKIMTAIIAIENEKYDLYVVKKEHLVGENSMGLTPGESLSLEELLYGLILNSGNDAAEVLADSFPGGRSKFISAMNDKAKSLGLKDTNFTNPTGLEGDGDQYTTAYDLLVISEYALRNFEIFRKVAGTFEHEIPYNGYHKEFFLQNETNLLSSYPGVKGIKDGYTPEAGLCLATYLDYKNHEIIGIILGSSDRRQEMKDLLDYSLKQQGVTPPDHM